MRSREDKVVKHLVRWTSALVLVVGLVGHARAEESASASTRPSQEELRTLESTLASSVARVEVERGGVLPFLRWALVPEVEHAEAPPREVVAGIFIGTNRVLTCLGEDPGFGARFHVKLGERSLAAAPKARDAKSGLMLLEVESSPASPVPVTLAARGRAERAAGVVPTTGGLSAWPATRFGESGDDSFLTKDALPLGTPIATAQGAVLGIVTSATPTISSPRFFGVAAPIRFSIARTVPADLLLDLAHQLETRGEVAPGWLGADVRSLELFEPLRVLAAGHAAGVRVTSVAQGSPADKGGLRERDVIVSLDGHGCASPSKLKRRLDAAGPGKRVKLEVLRDGAVRVIEVELGDLPAR